MSKYHGVRRVDGIAVVYKDGRRFSAARSQEVWNHSPMGFEWGYEGSGPAQLALAVLLDVVDNEELAVRLHQDFKRDVIARWPQERGGLVTEEAVREWVMEKAGCV